MWVGRGGRFYDWRFTYYNRIVNIIITFNYRMNLPPFSTTEGRPHRGGTITKGNRNYTQTMHTYLLPVFSPCCATDAWRQGAWFLFLSLSSLSLRPYAPPHYNTQKLVSPSNRPTRFWSLCCCGREGAERALLSSLAPPQPKGIEKWWRK